MATKERTILGLEEAAKAEVVRSLGELANDLSSSFCCGGRLEQQIVRINYKQNNGDLSDIALPGADEKDLSQLLAASSVASFGKGTEEVVDLSYRDAFKLDPDKLTTSFEISNTSILSDIETLLVPNRNIQAEIHKLNIYTGPNGHFKPHLDTPRSGEMLGSLVVCLPTKFSGGALVTRHLGQEVVFDWSDSFQGSDCNQNIQWAAFFSDVEHEILPVTSGHRITLTYDLYYAKERPSALPVISPFQHYLQEALENPYFMPEGGCLGFDCKHSYVFSTLNEPQLLPSVLKGADYMVFQVAKNLGLNVTIKPAIEEWDHWYLLPKFPKVFGKSGALAYDPDSFHHPTLSLLESTQISKETPEHVFEGVTWCRAKVTWQDVLDLVPVPIQTNAAMLEQNMHWKSVYDKLQWEYLPVDEYKLKAAGVCKQDIPPIIEALQKLQHKYRRVYQPIGAITYTGNEPTADIHMCYQSAVILVDVPCFVGCGPLNRAQYITMPTNTRLTKTLFWNKPISLLSYF